MAEQAENLPPIETSGGRRGKVTLDHEKGIVIKEFLNPDDPSNLPQIEVCRKILALQEKQGPVPGFPKVIEVVEEEGKVTKYVQELIEGDSLSDFLKKRGRLLSIAEAEKLFLTLVKLQEITGQPHGDIAESGALTWQNLMVTEGDNNQLNFYFIDYAGTADFNIPDPEAGVFLKDYIDSERRMILTALFIENPYSRNHNSSNYVEGSREDRLEAFRKFQKEYLPDSLSLKNLS